MKVHRALCLIAAAGLWLGAGPGGTASASRQQIGRTPIDPDGRLSDLRIERGPEGDRLIRVGDDLFTPGDFVESLEANQREAAARGLTFRLLNISRPAGMTWVGLGLLGQVLFTGRMVVQWLTSERAKQSVVPPAFWWMSLGGAAMLLAYFAWRRDIVGLLGQGTGFLIYARNLWLLGSTKREVRSTN